MEEKQMPVMDDDTKNKVLESMEVMDSPVHIIMFEDKEGCQLCEETKKIVEELSDLTGKLTHDVFEINKEKDLAEKYGVDKTPAIIIMKGTKEDHEYTGVRFFGIPAGYEFTSLLDSVLTTSRGETSISDETKEYLDGLEKDIHMEVFVTPQCPYCPRSVVLAHHLALVSGGKITADMIEASEFPEMAQKYQVMGVPRTIINGKHHQEGAAPEKMILDLIKRAAS